MHVVQAYGTNQTTVLDGFVITAGNANGANPTVNSGYGGGVLALDANPTLSHLLFSGNNATNNGGGLFSGSTVPGTQLNPAPILSEITLSGNAAMYGGGMFIDNSFKTQLLDITFAGNTAELRRRDLYQKHHPNPTDECHLQRQYSQPGRRRDV